MKIEILNVPTIKEDMIVSVLVGTQWEVKSKTSNGVIIDVSRDILIREGEYKIIN